MSAYWCELAWLGGEVPEPGVVIETEGGVITAVSRASRPPDGATTLSGLTLPGLANAHSHAFQRALRGRTQRAGGGTFWTWREEMYALARTLEPERIEALARATFAEMALAGITLVGEFDYLHCSPEMIRAATQAGIRITLIDACYLDGGLPRFRDADVHAWARRVDAIELADHARLGVAIHSVRAVDPVSAATVADFATVRDIPLHAHVSEQPAENEECRRRHGATPLGVLYGAEALSDRFTAVHATHLTDADVELLSESGAYGCLCPTTERDLADGIGSVHGRLTLGSDSQSVIDLFEEARAVELDERLRTGVRGIHAPSALAEALTRTGYASLGWEQGGTLAAGALADFATVSLDGIRLAGTRPEDALAAVLFAGTASDVSHVVVGGRTVVSDGVHVSLDVAHELAAAIP